MWKPKSPDSASQADVPDAYILRFTNTSSGWSAQTINEFLDSLYPSNCVIPYSRIGTRLLYSRSTDQAST